MTLLTLRRFEPKVVKSGYQNEYTDFLNSFERARSKYQRECGNNPPVNIWEQEKNFVLQVAAPGYKKEFFNINVEKDVLTISASVPEGYGSEREKFTRCEFMVTPFEREFTLGESIDSSKIDASFKDGILSVSLSKKEQAIEKPIRTINVD
ncbi:MAG TPA: Hsp20/alpha crystallin family protein [Tenuifilaceae bacterium]|nr:Hsp20/alpha crystallin family protein [Tenuifilaceae bacterium]HPE18018.1 Hsp20/alpha crystallin family protein [Tenuifilaceae bacterium]HPJ44620.1 Hsp20/alpha crystallin family protein [Tenuifilaceae bacterium]HPQ33978.1 Hsp20/alpha crystallin family protein [Tenuifilaceae bacterium]HRX68527.1 Hsp20/alpha crystallin family protein [Tenuifilaceae bacterium]